MLKNTTKRSTEPLKRIRLIFSIVKYTILFTGKTDFNAHTLTKLTLLYVDKSRNQILKDSLSSSRRKSRNPTGRTRAHARII